MEIELNNETHPDWYHDIPEMKILILGSYPPHENKRDYPFYYPNSNNNFWKILSLIANNRLPEFNKGEQAVNERKRIMQSLKCGVQNMGLKIIRKGKSAKDTDIEITEYQDILSIIINHPELEAILISGFSAKNSTYHSFIKYLDLNKKDYTLPKVIKPGESFSFNMGNRQIKCFIVNSTSPAAQRKVSFESLRRQFEEIIIPFIS